MASAFGTGLYGQDDFGLAFATLAGTVSVSSSLSGDFVKPVQRLSGTVSVSSSLSGDFRNVVQKFTGSGSVSIGVSAAYPVLLRSLVGSVGVDIGLTALAFNTRIIRFTSSLTFSLVLSGNLARVVFLSGSFEVSVSMSSSEYIGELWRPEIPDGTWVPVDPEDEIWVNVA